MCRHLGTHREFLVACLTFLTTVAWAQPQITYKIHTLAGSRVIENGIQAIQAQIRYPVGVAVDGAGNLYIADTRNNSIRKVDATGTITTIAGTGEYGFGGDGGPAVQALLRSPSGVAVDTSGNLYIADRENLRIRKVDATGTITTVAGVGEYGFAEDNGSAVQAQLIDPAGVAVDGEGNLYIADTRRGRIFKVDSTGTITTVTDRLSGPSGVAVDGAGNLYITESFNNRILKVDSTGTITTVAGTGQSGFGGDGGPALQARLSPSGVAVDGAGNLYIANTKQQQHP